MHEQPDLNWRNPAVVEAMHNALRFWLDRGVDGFRVDAISCLMKAPGFPDNPPAVPGGYWAKFGFDLEPYYTLNQPDTFHQVRLMRQVFDEYEASVHIGETSSPDFSRLILYYGEPLDGYDIPFNLTTLNAAWDAANLHKLIKDYMVTTN